MNFSPGVSVNMPAPFPRARPGFGTGIVLRVIFEAVYGRLGVRAILSLLRHG